MSLDQERLNLPSSSLTKIYSDPSVTRPDSLKIPEIEKLALPEPIRDRARELFHLLKKGIRRGKKRKQLIFYSIFNAYLEVGQEKDPNEIADMSGIKYSDMAKAFSIFSETQTGYRPSSVHVSPLNLIRNYARNLGIGDESIYEIVLLGKRIIEKDSSLNNQSPQKVATGILYYYLTIHGYQVDRSKFTEIVHLSDVTVTNSYNQIKTIDNS